MMQKKKIRIYCYIMVFQNFVWEDHSLAHRQQNQMTRNHPWDRLDPSWLDPAPWFDGCVCLFHSSDPTNLAYHIEPLCWHSNSTWHPLILYKIDVHLDIIRYLIHSNHLGRGHVSFEEGNPNERHAKNLMIRENRQPRGIGCMFCKIPEGHA